MSEVLSQSEIEALLSEMSSPSPAELSPADERAARLASHVSPGAGGVSKVILPLSKRRTAELTGRGTTLTYEPYDFRRSDKLSKEHLRTLQVIHEQFARLFTSVISGYLRSTVSIELISIEQVPYEEYIRSISASLINILNVAPLSGQSMLEVDLRILFAMIDRLLGGIGEGQYKQGKDLTDVEKVLGGNIVTRALTELNAAWHDVLALDFTVDSVESSAQFVQIVPSNDTVVLILFDIQIGEQRGAMSLSIPYMLLKPVAARLHTHRWFSSKQKISKQLAPKMAARLRAETRVPLLARLGTSNISVRTAKSLKVGQILPLAIAKAKSSDTDENPPGGGLAHVEIVIGTRAKFFGHIGLRGGKQLAVQIDEVLAAPVELQVHRTPPNIHLPQS